MDPLSARIETLLQSVLTVAREQRSSFLDGKYRLDRAVGVGGMGVVYQAFHLGVERLVAIKLMLHSCPDAVWLRRFAIEGKALGRLEHPNIVNVTDSGVDPRGFPYLVMEFLDGEDLAQVIRRNGPLPLHRAIEVLRAIAVAVDFAHGRGILHRDLKAQNVFLARSTTGEQIKVLDFGIATLLRPSDIPRPEVVDSATVATDAATIPMKAKSTSSAHMTAAPLSHGSRASVLVGTVTHMAPELFASSPASRSTDIYSLGILAHELLTGTTPFRGSAPEIAHAHLHTPALPLSHFSSAIPPEVDAAVALALAKDHAARPATAEHLVRSLELAVHRAAVREWKRHEIPRRRKIAAAIGLASAIIAMALGRAPQIEALEQRTLDYRFALLPENQANPRVVTVLLDERSLEGDPKPLIARDAELASIIRRLIDNGAEHVAVDLIMPPQWAESQPLTDVFLRYHNRLTLAAFSSAILHVFTPWPRRFLITDTSRVKSRRTA